LYHHWKGKVDRNFRPWRGGEKKKKGGGRFGKCDSPYEKKKESEGFGRPIQHYCRPRKKEEGASCSISYKTGKEKKRRQSRRNEQSKYR